MNTPSSIIILHRHLLVGVEVHLDLLRYFSHLLFYFDWLV